MYHFAFHRLPAKTFPFLVLLTLSHAAIKMSYAIIDYLLTLMNTLFVELTLDYFRI